MVAGAGGLASRPKLAIDFRRNSVIVTGMRYVFIAIKPDGELYCIAPTLQRCQQIISDDCSHGLVTGSMGARYEPCDIEIREFPFSE